MDIDEIIAPAAIMPGLKAASKRQALQELAARAAKLTGIDERQIFNVLLERERLGTTGIGQGVAIPHGKVEGLKRVVGLFARAERPIDFDAVDEVPVDLFFLLLAPADAGAAHLKALAQVSRLLRDAGFCEKLRGAANADALAALLIRKAAA
ncbi:MAG: PTS IIA-like nitrogen-regulatory protein PtsN [Alphaproteobacteria bacterium]|nr:MAG: PTS IIA-like nitrogen-regulatory protein PtsN [Alphaproteobacteria bacterium]